MKINHIQKLIKISDTHYIVVDDSEIKEGDCYYSRRLKRICINIGDSKIERTINLYKKITHSTKPLEQSKPISENCGIIEPNVFINIKPLSLSEVEEFINGYSWKTEFEKANLIYGSEHHSFYLGFKAHQELTKDKFILSKKQLVDAILFGVQKGINIGKFEEADSDWVNNYIKSLLPTEWDIEFDEQGKLKLV